MIDSFGSVATGAGTGAFVGAFSALLLERFDEIEGWIALGTAYGGLFGLSTGVAESLPL